MIDFSILKNVTCEVALEFNDLSNKIRDTLGTMDDKSLKQLIKSIKKVSIFNSSWLTYELAPMIKHYAEEALRRRE
jgi:hypothetical protein